MEYHCSTERTFPANVELKAANSRFFNGQCLLTAEYCVQIFTRFSQMNNPHLVFALVKGSNGPPMGFRE